MELLYTKEHLSCLNYNKKSHPAIEKVILKQEEQYPIEPNVSRLMCVLQGSIHVIDEHISQIIESGKMILFTPNEGLIESATAEGAEILIFRLNNIKQLCDCFPLNMLMCEKEDDSNEHSIPLAINERIVDYIKLLDACLSEGLKCIYYYEIKIKELYFLLRAYYHKKELFNLFYPILSHDLTFSDFVMRNHHKAKTVQELADLLHYSLSGFQKKFKKVFGVSPYQWIKEERIKSIYHNINQSNKSLKEISDDYGFSSPSHFNDFCKSNFGSTPGKLRKQYGNKNNTQQAIGTNYE